MSPKADSLSANEQKLLSFILSYWRDHGQEPTRQQIGLEASRLQSKAIAKEPPISRQEWEERTERVARGCREGAQELKAWRLRHSTQHRQTYEHHHGPIPRGYHIHHKDGNHKNNDPRNLEAIRPRIHRMKHTLLGQHLPVIDSKAP